ncbi:hypothetical protein BDQ17DRAFT_1537887 [Cyathus striatus]|nr:hypothetical protein BDQ17DRAFT_1537887 [Cyathus striatus]
MSRFIELAKGFQSAYMNTALFSVSASYDNYEDREINYHVIGSIVDVRVQGTMGSSAFDGNNATGGHVKQPMRLRPAGYRASVCDVTHFLRPEVICPATASCVSSCSSNFASTSSSVYTDPDSDSECTHTIPELDHRDTSGSTCSLKKEQEIKYIPLTSPYPPVQPPRTVLPYPLPYKLVFKPIPPPARSPFRFNVLPLSAYTANMYSRCHSHNPAPSAHKHHGGNAGEQITWRVRSIANPMYLRLKAAQNCICGRGEPADGVGKDFGLGSGKERMVGVAFEGVGKSWLGAA